MPSARMPRRHEVRRGWRALERRTTALGRGLPVEGKIRRERIPGEHFLKGCVIAALVLSVVLAACSDEDPVGLDSGPLAGRVFVVNSLGGTLSIVGRTAEGRLSAQNDVVELGPGANSVTLAVEEEFVAVPDGFTNRLLVFDERTLAPRCSASLPAGSSPNGVTIGGGAAYVSLLIAGSVARVDLATCSVERIGEVGPGPADLELHGDRLLVVVGNLDFSTGAFPIPRLGPSYVAVLDPLTLALRDTISTGGFNAQFAALDGDGDLLVMNSGDFGGNNSSLSVLDPIAERLVAGPFPLGDFGTDIVVGPDNTAYVTSFSDGLYVFDASANRVLRGGDNPLAAPPAEGSPRGSSGVAVDRRGNVLSVFFGPGQTPGQVFLFDAEEVLVDSVSVGFGPVGAQFEEAAQPR
jgi:hypothetical protein